ncbi:hypothetical protein [Nitratireductor sp. GCM10026969]|uniref:hypothetical protein n=1 Tax=Nitratireductor sp. GCM10026969 TaxID=3252645 RepID=UPI00361C11CD
MTVEKNLEAEIDALLAKDDDTASIIDTLLAMPRPAGADDSWEKVLHERLQARLARRMREALEGDTDSKISRSAA